MGGEWRQATLGDVLTLQRGFDLPETQRVDGPYPVIASTGSVGTHTAAMVRGPGVVIGRSGSLGGGQLIRSDFWPLNTTLWVRDFKGNDVRFCYYLLKSLDLATFNAGSGVPTLNRNHIHPLPVRVPVDTQEQQAIGRTLGALDDKIELDRRMNETLDAMSRALFRSWFVDFDPVRAKADGRDPGLPQHVAELFPDRFEVSELGEVPDGWRVATLEDISDKPEYGYTASANDEHVGPNFLRITDINKRPWIEWASVPYCPIASREREKYRLDEGDILIARMADPGHAALIEEPVDAVFASYLIRFRPLDKRYGRFLQYWVRSEKYWELVRARGAGTTRASLNAKVLRRFQLALPPVPVAEAFSNHAGVMRDRLVASVREAQTLAALRDALLPKLVSGDLRVPEAERIVEAAPL